MIINLLYSFNKIICNVKINNIRFMINIYLLLRYFSLIENLNNTKSAPTKIPTKTPAVKKSSAKTVKNTKEK